MEVKYDNDDDVFVCCVCFPETETEHDVLNHSVKISVVEVNSRLVAMAVCYTSGLVYLSDNFAAIFKRLVVSHACCRTTTL